MYTKNKRVLVGVLLLGTLGTRLLLSSDKAHDDHELDFKKLAALIEMQPGEGRVTPADIAIRQGMNRLGVAMSGDKRPNQPQFVSGIISKIIHGAADTKAHKIAAEVFGSEKEKNSSSDLESFEKAISRVLKPGELAFLDSEEVEKAEEKEYGSPLSTEDKRALKEAYALAKHSVDEKVMSAEQAQFLRLSRFFRIQNSLRDLIKKE